jgi:hypothetical protein
MSVQQPQLVGFSRLIGKRIEITAGQYPILPALQTTHGFLDTDNSLEGNIQTHQQHHKEFPEWHIPDA